MRNRDEAAENNHPKRSLQTVADSITIVPQGRETETSIFKSFPTKSSMLSKKIFHGETFFLSFRKNQNKGEFSYDEFNNRCRNISYLLPIFNNLKVENHIVDADDNRSI